MRQRKNTSRTPSAVVIPTQWKYGSEIKPTSSGRIAGTMAADRNDSIPVEVSPSFKNAEQILA